MKPYAYSDDYPTCVATHSSLRIFSERLTPDEITAALEQKPTRSFTRGDLFGKNNQLRKTTGWLYSTEKLMKSRDTRRHLDQILAVLKGKQTSLDKLVSDGCSVDVMSFWLSIGHGGPIIEPEQMHQFSALNIRVWWDVYFDDREVVEA
ncbi:MAG: DUF4279 domain-containing protein [Pseudomonadota bacterium]